MEKDKKKIIAGAGIVAGVAGIAYLISRRPPTPPVYTCPYCGAKFSTLAELQAHILAEHPETPPPTQFGQVDGQVFDASTNSPILIGKIYVDGIFNCDLGPSGTYRTSNISYGAHTIRAEADNYQESSIIINLQSSFMDDVDFFLSKLPPAPMEWTEGTVVQSIAVNPPTVFLGEVANIDVYIQGPYPAEYPLTIFGTVQVNGDSVRQSFTITHRNPTLRFYYTPTRTGGFTVRSQDKSATFTVMSGETGEFYCPFGGIRLPVCTIWKLARPIMGPYDVDTYNKMPEDFPSESIIGFSTSPVFGYFRLPRSMYKVWRPEDMDALLQGTPVAWYPPVDVTQWEVIEVPELYGIFVRVMVYSTPNWYWETREELAKAIGRVYLHRAVLGGSPYYYPNLYYSHYLTSGITNEDKDIVFGHQQIYRNTEPYDYILCPYCEQQVRNYESPYPMYRDSGDIILGRKLLEHIESAHPNHPLTKPAWF